METQKEQKRRIINYTDLTDEGIKKNNDIDNVKEYLIQNLVSKALGSGKDYSSYDFGLYDLHIIRVLNIDKEELRIKADIVIKDFLKQIGVLKE